MQVETDVSIVPYTYLMTTGEAQNEQLLELERNHAKVDSFAMNCHCRYQDIIKFLIKIFKKSQFPHGE